MTIRTPEQVEATVFHRIHSAPFVSPTTLHTTHDAAGRELPVSAPYREPAHSLSAVPA